MTTEQLAAQKASARDKRRFVKLTMYGSSCTVRPEEVADMMEGREPDDPMTQTDVWMTQAEYEALPEFMGW